MLSKILIALRKANFSIVVCILLAVFLIEPLLAPGFPNTADGFVHLFRSALWRWAWDDGVLWPRWHTLLYFGYGYPLFNFYAPLLYIITSALSLILPNILVAFKATLFIASLCYSLGMYLWARETLGDKEAIVAATAYTFAPFRFRELYFQGNYAQFVAWGLYPLVLFSFHRLIKNPSRGSFLGACLSFALLVLTHNISVMLFTPFLLAYVILLNVELLCARDKEFLKKGLLLISAFICALALSSAFWLPALVEAKYTKVHVLTKGFFDVSEHFLRVRELLASSPPLDYRAANPPMPFNWGRFHLLLAVIGSLTILKRDICGSRKWLLIFALAGFMLSSFMMLPASLFIWRNVPFIAFAEFPSRMYGVGFIFSSLLAGASVRWVRSFRYFEILITTIAVVGLIISVAVYQFPRPFLSPEISPHSFVVYEKAYNVPGTTSAGEYLSIWNSVVPAFPAIRPDLSRVALIEPPQSVEARVTEAKTQSLQLQISTSHAVEIEVAQFYFPGWQGWIDDVEVPVKPCGENGFICLTVPPGEHIVYLRFGSTFIRRIAWVLSLIGAFAIILIAFRLRKREIIELPPLKWKESVILGGVILGLLGLKVLWIGPHTSWFRIYSPEGEALPARYPIKVVMGGEIALIGYDVEPQTLPQGGELHVRLYWQALKPLNTDYSSFVHLVAGPQRVFFVGSDSMHPAYIPTSTWHPSLYVVDDHYIRLPPDIDPIAFDIMVGLYEQRTMKSLGETILPTWVNVLPRKSVNVRKIPYRLDAHFGDALLLLGYDLKEEENSFILTLYWQAKNRISQDFQIFIHILDKDGHLLSQADSPPVGGMYPTSRWWPGQIIEDVHCFPVPSTGRPHFILTGLYDLATMERVPAFQKNGFRWEGDAVVISIYQDTFRKTPGKNHGSEWLFGQAVGKSRIFVEAR